MRVANQIRRKLGLSEQKRVTTPLICCYFDVYMYLGANPFDLLELNMCQTHNTYLELMNQEATPKTDMFELALEL